MTYNDVIKAIDKIINREYPEDVVPTAVCTIEFFKIIRDIIDGYRNEASYFEDQIDDINREHYDIICELRGEIKRLKKYKNLYEDLKAENLETIKAINKCKAEAIREFVNLFYDECLEDALIDGDLTILVNRRDFENLVREITEEET